ncbi:MAG: hypothetical protein WC544_03475 [Patescibacteria group bacterium]
MTALEKAIIATLSYFDVFDYPLTPMEVWKWLYVEPAATDLGTVSIEEVMQTMAESEWLRRRIETNGGFYFLRGRAGIVDVRQQRYLWAEGKFSYAKKIIGWLRWAPFVRMVGVCNTLAYNNSRRAGDIDLFIVTARHRTWQARWWVNSFLRLLRLRPSLGNTQDKMCSSFFVDVDHLGIEQLAIPGDVYLPYWVAQVYPVYDEGVYTSFVQANEWVRRVLPHWLPIAPVFRRQVNAHRWLKRIKEFFFIWWPERLFRRWQQAIMPAKLRTMANQDTRVIITDSILKFHDMDRRQMFLEQWRVKMEEVLRIS